jgi:hypothetical protein|tara:strand:- start:15 stop:269 length:255 start_codon:yes stop_codon:yes gene_type:complete
MTEPTPLNQEGRDLLIHVEGIADQVRRGEVVGLLSVCVLADTKCETQAAGLFYDGYTMAGHLMSLQKEMIEMEEPIDFEVIIDD